MASAAAAAIQPANGNGYHHECANGHANLPGQAQEAPHAAHNGGHHRNKSSKHKVILSQEVPKGALKLIGDPNHLGGAETRVKHLARMERIQRNGSQVVFEKDLLVEDQTNKIVDPIPQGASQATPEQVELLRAQQAEIARRQDQEKKEVLAAEQAAERLRLADEEARAQSCCYRIFGCCKPK